MLLVAGAAYHAAPSLPYVWDDDVLIAGLGGLEAPLGARLHAAWSPFLGVYLRPIPLTLLAVELGAGRFASLLSHGVNLGFFVLACLALMSWLRAEQLSARAAGLTTVFFASLPVASEAVLWTSARGDLIVLGCAGFLLALTAQRFPIRLHRASPLPDDHAGGVAGLVLLLLLALLSKESGVAVAVAVAVRALWPTVIGQGRPGGRRLWWMVPVGLAGGFLLLRWAVLPELPPSELPEPEGVDRALLSLATVAAQTGRVFWPWLPDLSVGLHAVPISGDVAPWLGLIVLAAAGGLAMLAHRFGAPRVALASALYLLFLAPTSNLVSLDIVARTADRFALLPWLPVGLLLACGLQSSASAERRPRLGLILRSGVAAVALLGIFLTAQRVGAWADEERFYRTLATEADAGNGYPGFVLGTWLAAEDRCEEAEQVLGSSADLLEVQGRKNSAARARASRSGCLEGLGRGGEAFDEARAAALLDPSVPGTAARAVRLLRVRGDFEASVKEGVASLALHPLDADVASELSLSLAGSLRFSEAAAALVEVRSRAGMSGSSELLTALGRSEESARGARAAIEQGDAAGYVRLAALAEDWGNSGLAVELAAQAQVQPKGEAAESR